MAHYFRWGVALALAAIMITGCTDDDALGVDGTSAISNDDAADAIAFSLSGSQSSGGLTAQLEESTTMAGAGLINKTDQLGNASWDTTVARARMGIFSYAYAFHFNLSLVSGSRLDFSYTMKVTYDTPRMSSADSAAALFQVSNLMTGTSYAVSGTYTRLGTQTSKVRQKNTWTSVITVTMSGLSVDKSTMKITSGSANLTMVGSSGSGNAYALNGKLTFIGANQAILMIGGQAYTIDLSTGEATLAG